MKTWLASILLLISFTVAAQEDDLSLPPYKRFPTLPTLHLMLGDSATQYTKQSLPANKPVVIMLFSPDCDHCQHETEELVKHKDAFNDVQLVMATTYPLHRMNKYAEDYRVKEIPGVVLGRDQYYLLLPFFDVKNFPFLAVYNKKGDLVYAGEGTLPVKKILELAK